MRESGYMWPIIDLHVRYVKPLRFEQRILVKASLREWENRLLIDYLVTDAESGARLTKGRTSQVAVDMKTGEMCFVSPAIVFEKLGVPRP
jgi:acyl-CoA thioester hydrolase